MIGNYRTQTPFDSNVQDVGGSGHPALDCFATPTNLKQPGETTEDGAEPKSVTLECRKAVPCLFELFDLEVDESAVVITIKKKGSSNGIEHVPEDRSGVGGAK